MTDNEIIKAFKCCCVDTHPNCNECPIESTCANCDLDYEIFSLINRKRAKIKEFDEKLVIQQGLIDYQKAEIERLNKDCEELIYKIEYLLCHATGNKFSKYTYPIGDMVSYVNDYIQDCCNEAVEEAKEAIKSEAIREFAERLKEHRYGELNNCISFSVGYLDNLVKEMTEGN